jgi:lysophospholipase L1-like esterase
MRLRAVVHGIMFASVVMLFGCGSSSPDGEIGYVALGASDAAGIGAFPPTDGYVFLIDERLSESCASVSLTNLAIPGTELEAVIEIQIPIVDELGAELITLWPGPNDLIGGKSIFEFQKDLQEVVDSLLVETSAEIFFGNIPDLTQIPRFKDDPSPNVTSERINAYNNIILQMTLDPRVRLVDLAAIDVDPALVSSIDGFHPNDKGHSVIADLFLDEILPVFCG